MCVPARQICPRWWRNACRLEHTASRKTLLLPVSAELTMLRLTSHSILTLLRWSWLVSALIIHCVWLFCWTVGSSRTGPICLLQCPLWFLNQCHTGDWVLEVGRAQPLRVIGCVTWANITRSSLIIFICKMGLITLMGLLWGRMQ